MMRIDHREKDLENHDRGLDYDLPRLLHRRGMLKLVAGAGVAGTGLITLGACAATASTAESEQSVRNLSRVSLDGDNVFSDGYDLQMPTVTGDPTNGYQLSFSCAV